MSLAKVQAFYERLATDEAFRTQIQGVESQEECRKLVKGSGYDFTQEEFEEYTAQLLESTVDEEGIRDLNERELEAVFGGISRLLLPGFPPIQLYGLPPIYWLV
jgi:predicted ribosomally synthesized peptide with nif11-like leader